MQDQDAVSPDASDERVVAGRYRLLSPLGAGGMGTVWRARDEMLRREVAVKEVRAPAGLPAAKVERMYTRLEREAWAAARITGRNVITVHDVVTDAGRPWIVMEFVRGRSLGELIASEGALTPREAARIGAEVLAALRSAHEAGVLHRDVKPANVLLSQDERVILTDFGIAMVQGDTALTLTGEVVGSPEYLAPEQALGRTPGPATDLWSLGVLLHTAVQGRSPFRRENTLGTLRAVVDEEPPAPHRAGPLAPVIEGLLRKDPAERTTAERVAEQLRLVAAGSTVGADTEDTDPETRPVTARRDTSADATPTAVAAADTGMTAAATEAGVTAVATDPGATVGGTEAGGAVAHTDTSETTAATDAELTSAATATDAGLTSAATATDSGLTSAATATDSGLTSAATATDAGARVVGGTGAGTRGTAETAPGRPASGTSRAADPRTALARPAVPGTTDAPAAPAAPYEAPSSAASAVTPAPTTHTPATTASASTAHTPATAAPGAQTSGAQTPAAPHEAPSPAPPTAAPTPVAPHGTPSSAAPTVTADALPAPHGPQGGPPAPTVAPPRRPGRRKATLWAAAAAAFVVLAGGLGYALANNGDEGDKGGTDTKAGTSTAGTAAGGDQDGAAVENDGAAAPPPATVSVTGAHTTYAGSCPPPQGQAPTFTATFEVTKLPTTFTYRWVSSGGTVVDRAWRKLSFAAGGPRTHQESISVTSYARAGTLSSAMGVEIKSEQQTVSDTVPFTLTCQ
ncbi:serine/threonine protein kinase [Streptomyces griseoaurantiacus M045]|uniref:non-specific serine/threonine protein kinase n=1 Tax=Streptomyces griseoaurantiacus M045 TaxID=996637 RepID=F3NB97_9ACTN|nr:serine/threonine protein kinase [Streptomyces griseoaurantiacus M045]